MDVIKAVESNQSFVTDFITEHILSDLTTRSTEYLIELLRACFTALSVRVDPTIVENEDREAWRRVMEDLAMAHFKSVSSEDSKNWADE